MSASPPVKLLYVTDPLCAWCWGTLPELEAARRQLGDSVEFDLIMAGMKIGRDDGLAEYNKRRLTKLWREVRQVTGQVFSERLPDDFVFDSDLACRSVEIMRIAGGNAPWDFFRELQTAFFVDAKDTNNIEVLGKLMGLDRQTAEEKLADPQIAAAVAANKVLIDRLSANALPNIQIDTGDGFRLLSGGFISSEFLVPEIRQRMELAGLR